MRVGSLLALVFIPISVHAQWSLQQSHTTSDLRSVDALSETTAWASGDSGTVLRTTDGGATWQSCAVPKGAEKLDLVGVQGSDENTAVAVSTGQGSLSRVYKTADGCRTWKLVFTNPDAGGSFKGIRRMTDRQFYLLGDPVDGKFSIFYSGDSGDTWNGTDDPGLDSEKGEGAFSPGNGALVAVGPFLFFGSRSSSGLHLYHTYPHCETGTQNSGGCPIAWAKTDVPLASGDPAKAEFSLAARTQVNMRDGSVQTVLVAVGSASAGSAATSRDDGKSWKPAAAQPAAGLLGLAYGSFARLWIAVGPNGTYVSADDGQRWRSVSSASAGTDSPGQSWSALSLPFVVGGGGKIGKLDPNAFKH
jgi:photosystem II stability/assembly factor-like uncharacterized protein